MKYYIEIITGIVFLSFVSFTNAQAPRLVINELQSSNITTVKDRNNQYEDWLEIYNADSKSVNIAGMYFSVDPDKQALVQVSSKFPAQTTIPPGGVKYFWFDRRPEKGANHINLKLKSGDGYVALYHSDGTTLIDSIYYGQQRVDISYGRFPDATGPFMFFLQPTPGKLNQTTAYKGYADPPEINIKGGFYASPLVLKIAKSDDQVYYTTDGSRPSIKNGKIYEKPIHIDSTKVVRAVALRDGYIPSDIATETFFIGEKFSLPVVSLSTKSRKVFTNSDPKENIYNERKASLEYYDNEGNQIFNTDVGFRLVGKAIRNYPQKSIAIRFRTAYGLEKVRYKFFVDKDETDYYSILLRNSGNDWSNTMIKDALMHRMVTGTTNIDCQGYSPVVVFINGKYWGIHNLREKINKYYVKSNFPEVNVNKIDMMEYGAAPIQGDKKHYDKMMEYISNSDFKIPGTIDSVYSLIDIDNFIDYNCAEIFYANCDWPMANMKYWRPKTQGGRWRWILFDTDLGFDKNKRYCPNKGHHNTLLYALGENNCHLPHLTKPLYSSTTIFRKLMDDQGFREDFILRFSDLMNTIWSAENILETIDSLKRGIEKEMPRHIKRWKPSKKGIPSMSAWEGNLAKLNEFARERADTMRYFINKKYDLGGVVPITISVSEPKGTVKVNSIEIDSFPWTGYYFRNQKIAIEAIPYDHCKFKGWSDGEKDAKRYLSPDGLSLEAEFK